MHGYSLRRCRVLWINNTIWHNVLHLYCFTETLKKMSFIIWQCCWAFQVQAEKRQFSPCPRGTERVWTGWILVASQNFGGSYSRENRHYIWTKSRKAVSVGLSLVTVNFSIVEESFGHCFLFYWRKGPIEKNI